MVAPAQDMLGSSSDDGYVLDSLAILALLGDEPGADEVAELLSAAPEQALVTYANLSEVMHTAIRERGQDQADTALLALESSGLTFVPAERNLTLPAARIKAHHRVSYADAYCAALSKTRASCARKGVPRHPARGHPEHDVCSPNETATEPAFSSTSRSSVTRTACRAIAAATYSAS